MSDGNTSPSPRPAITSNLATDPEMVELIEMFVEDMPEKVANISETFARSEFSDLRRLAHQLKGACGGYGFPDVGAAAARVEATLLQAGSATTANSLTSLRTQVDELIDLCRRVSAR